MSLKTNQLEETVKQFEKKLLWQKEHGRSLSKQLHTKAMGQYFLRASKAREEGKPLAVTSVTSFPELLHAMGVVNFAPAQYAIQLMVQGFSTEYIDKGLGLGVSSELCAGNIASIGMAKEGVFPTPDIMLATAQQPCDSAAIESELLQHFYQVPIFWFNFPYRNDEETVEYVKEQFEEMIEFVEEHTRARYDEKRLRELLENAKEAHYYFKEIGNLRTSRPSPLGSRDAYSAYSIRMFMEGLPETTEMLKTMYEEVKEKVEKGEGVVPEERHRLMVSGVFPFWNMKLFDWMEQEFGAVCAVDAYNGLLMEEVGDTSDPLECIARKSLRANAFARAAVAPFPEFCREWAEKAKEAGCDCHIFFAHFGCKVTCGYNKLLLDAARDVAGIRGTVIDMDAYDPRVVSEAQIKSKITAYFEMLEGDA